jgi:long-chain alkane monooxygenase
VLYQAGTSSRGKAFAARHAEAVFLLPRDDQQAAEEIADLRRLAVLSGRAPDHVKAFVGAEVVVAPTRAEAEDKLALLQEYRDVEGHLVLFSGWAGIDLSGDDTDSYLQYNGGDAMQTFERMWSQGPERKKVGELVQHLSRPENDNRFVYGTPSEVADRIEELVDVSDADGINLIQHLSPGTFVDFIDLVVPELQRRGRYRTSYVPGETLRERLFGSGHARPLADHPASTFSVGRQQVPIVV